MASADERIDLLYGLPLEEFTPERNALAKELRGEGERDTAAAVAELRKPSRASWAINRFVRDRPAAAEALLAAADALAGAQEAVISGSGREALDDAVAAEREAVEEIVEGARSELEAAGSASPAMVDRARKTLHAVAGDPELQAELAAGRVTGDREPVGFGAAPAAAGGAGPKAAKAPARASAPKAKRGGRAKAKAAGRDTEPVGVSRKRLAEARRRAQRAERKLATGERDLEAARRRLSDAHEAVAAREREVTTAEEELANRRRELDDTKAVLEELS